MTGVVHSMFNQQRLDPASFQSQFSPIQTTPSISFCPSASGELELFLEATPCVNFFDLQQLIASAMSFQHHSIDQGQIHPQTSNNSQQQMSADAAPFPFDNSSQQTSMLQPSPSFVEPSGNYNEIPTSTTTNTFYTTNNLENAGNNTYPPRNFGPSQQSQQHPQNLIPYNYHYQGYQNTVPSSIGSSIGSNSCQHKPIPGITTAATTLPINISGQNLFLPQYNQTNPLLLPVYDHSSTVFTTKSSVNTTIPTTVAISQNSNSSVTTSENNNTPKPYSYGGPPKSYYSRLPLYDRPFKCDQCPQSFNRNHDLKRHKRIHLAVKPYPCPYCDKQFSRKDALKRHILVKGCNNTANNSNNKRSTSPKSGNKKIESTTTTSISPIENYVDNESTIKTEPMGDNNNYGMSI